MDDVERVRLTIREMAESFADQTTDPDRPFTGHPHTDNGERGKTEVRGICFRDLADCVVKALVDAAPDASDELRARADDGTLLWNDVYGLDLSEVNSISIVQNVSCRVEKMMGIYPNLPPLHADG